MKLHTTSATLVASLAAANLARGAVLEQRQASTISTIPSSMWSALNVTVGGRLARGEPFSRPCYSLYSGGTGSANATECQIRKDKVRDERYRLDIFGAAHMTQWESCPTENSFCRIDPVNPSNPAPFTTSCGQGSIAPYYIAVKQASDVTAAFMFSQMTKVPLTIKNTGHDFAGRSHGKDTLSLWTHNLQTIVRNQNFVADQCATTTATDAVTFGAGVHWEKVYQWAEDNHVTVVGGNCPSVGGAGGWPQGGGHSALSNAFGMGVDRVLQYKVVTPDGQLRIVNRCQNTDLFWAMRGGGAGTWGVALETTYKLEPQLTLQVYTVGFPQSVTPERVRAWTQLVVDNSIRLAELGWGGSFQPARAQFINAKLNNTYAQTTMKPFIDFMASLGVPLEGTNSVTTSSSWLEYAAKVAIAGTEEIPGWVGTPSGRLIQKANFATAQARTALVEAMLKVYAETPAVSTVFAAGYTYKYEVGGTSLHPAWRDSVWFVLLIDIAWPFDSDAAALKAKYEHLSKTTDYLRAITQFEESGTYMNESDVYEPNWEKAYFGSNYPKLLTIKQKYDPNGLLDCWRCVGWKGAADSRYKCYV